MGEKGVLTMTETIDYFELSRRKFRNLLKSQELQDLGYDLAMTGFDEKELTDLFSDGTDSDAKDDDFDLTAALEYG